MTDELHYRIFKLLEAQPDLSQRQLSKELGVSLGKANYCLKAVLDKGWIKANNFKNSQNKIAYVYLLTPQGLERKAKLTLRFLKRKIEEFEQVKLEIEQLRREADVLKNPGLGIMLTLNTVVITILNFVTSLCLRGFV